MILLLHFWKQHQIFHMLKKTMSLIAKVSLKILHRKNVVAEMPENIRLRTPWKHWAILPNFVIFVG